MERVVLTVKQLKQQYGIGITKIYEEMGAGRLPFRKLGRRTLIRQIDADAWLAALPNTGLTGFGRKPEPEPQAEQEARPKPRIAAKAEARAARMPEPESELEPAVELSADFRWDK